jgi:hypothetical protein
MSIEKEVNNTYHVFKLGTDKLNWTYVAEGPVMQNHDVHTPWHNQDMGDFAESLVRDHMDYLTKKSCFPRHSGTSYISFSYKPPYDGAVMGTEVCHTERLNDEEKKQFEKGMVAAQIKFWKPLGGLPHGY